MWLVHGDWTYQLMLRTRLETRVMEKLVKVALKLKLAMAMAMVTVSVVQLPVAVVVARYV
jgi:hypothetical protein